jgi:hypothetical protein
MKRYLIALGVLVLALAASAALIQGIKAVGPDEARVRVVHAVSDGPAIDIKVDGLPVASNVTYKTVTAYETLPAGPHLVQIYLSALPIELLAETVILTGGMEFTVAGVGSAVAVTTTTLVDNNHPSNVDTVRFANLYSHTPSIDVVITGTMTSTVVTGIPYKEASNYIGGIGVGEASFEVRASGLITHFTGTLESDTINTFFIMGPPGSLEQVHSIDQRWPFSVFLPLVIKGG